MTGTAYGEVGFCAPGADPEPKHFCPGCGKALPFYPRYPWYFCEGCLTEAEDGDGYRLEFANVGLSGGFQWRRAGSPDWQVDGELCCLLRGRPVVVGEARMGGIVAQPIDSSAVWASPDPDRRLRDVTRRQRR